MLKTLLTTGASKLNARKIEVPAKLPTVSKATGSSVKTSTLRHATAVADVHDDVSHAILSRAAVADCSFTPKLRPVTVIELPPLTATFLLPCDCTGASKL
jgi:hypothetical protein